MAPVTDHVGPLAGLQVNAGRLERDLHVLVVVRRHHHGAIHGLQRSRRTIPRYGAAVVVDARLPGARILLAATVVENHLRAGRERIRHLVLVTGLVAVVGSHHLNARPGRVVLRGRPVAGVHVRVHLAPTGRLGRIDGVLRHRRCRKRAGHRNGDRIALGTGLCGDGRGTGLLRRDRTVGGNRGDGRVGGAPAHGRTSRIGGGGQLFRNGAIGKISGVAATVDLHAGHRSRIFMATDVGHGNGERVFVGLLVGVVDLRGGVRQIGIVVHRHVIRQRIHCGKAEGGCQFNAETVLFDMVRGGAEFAQRNGDLVVIVHACGVVAQIVEVDPLCGAFLVGTHVADHSTVAFTPAAVDADHLAAQDAVAVTELDAGSLGVGLGVGCRTIFGVGIKTCSVALVDPRTVGTVGGNRHDLVDVLLTAPLDAGSPQGSAGGKSAVLAHSGAFVLRVDGDVERQILRLPQVALAERIIVAGVDHVLHVGHFPHEVQIVVIVGTIQCIQINRHLIHGIRSVDARIVVGCALCDQHGAVPIGDARAFSGIEADGFLHAEADFVRAISRGEVLFGDFRLGHRGFSGEFGSVFRACAGHGHGHGLAHGDGAAHGDDVTVLEGAGLAFGGRVLEVFGLACAQGHVNAASAECCGRRFRGNVRLGFGLQIVGADRVALGGAGGDLAAGNGDASAVDFVRIHAVVKVGAHAGEALVAAHVGDYHAIVGGAVLGEAFDHQAGLVGVVLIGAAVLQIFALAVHGVTEVVDGHDRLVLPHVVARITQLGLLGELCIGSARADRTVEVQRCAGLAGAHDRPAEYDLIIGQIRGFLVAIGVVVMRLHPSDELVFLGAAGIDVLHHLGAQIA